MKLSAPAAPGRLTVLAALLASLSAPALADSSVVISQVYGAGGNGTGATAALLKHDFIELYNRSSAPVSLNGWSVQYASATGSSWQVTPLTNVTLQPGQFYMVQEAAGAGGTATTVAADKVGTIPMAGGAGKVALANTTTAFTVANPSGAALVDLVGYGSTANFSEGGTPTGTLGNLAAALRKGNGCTDTDNNGADFDVLAPNPRNSAVVQACGAPVFKPIVATCPSTLSVAQGYSGSAPLTATDEDSIVTGAAITAGAMPGISLDGFSAAGAVGGTASVSLGAAASLAVGSYPVTIQFANDGGQFATCPVTVKVTGLANVTMTIPQIQGASAGDAPSPVANTVQTAEGVVTLKVANGFFMQDAAGDNDPTSSDGIFVYTVTAPTVQVGQVARVTGLVFEYTPNGAKRSYTEFKDVTAVVPMGEGPAVTSLNSV